MKEISLHTNSPVPLYKQLVQQLIVEIAKGNLKYGEAMPSIRAMALQTKLNLHTVHKSYKELQLKGLIIRKPHSKVFIINPHSSPLNDSDLQQISIELEQVIVEAYVLGLEQHQLQQIFSDISQRYSFS
ncbi:GntR family transcriptional regulator [Lysinibacillus parviboronicapiens]|uniref:GntR family transcriptional regulator n=1 Tax=Lysinibacillus parviboronicapiens TaxID=436516 RepID=UPI0030831ADE